MTKVLLLVYECASVGKLRRPKLKMFDLTNCIRNPTRSINSLGAIWYFQGARAPYTRANTQEKKQRKTHR